MGFKPVPWVHDFDWQDNHSAYTFEPDPMEPIIPMIWTGQIVSTLSWVQGYTTHIYWGETTNRYPPWNGTKQIGNLHNSSLATWTHGETEMCRTNFSRCISLYASVVEFFRCRIYLFHLGNSPLSWQFTKYLKSTSSQNRLFIVNQY